MKISNFIQFKSIDSKSYALFFLVMAMLLLAIYLLRKLGNSKIAEILENKRKVTELLHTIEESLINIEFFNDRMIKENEVLESFNDVTISTALECAKYYYSFKEKLPILNDSDLADKIRFYFTGHISMLMELSKMEKDAEGFQKEYHLKIAGYTRKLDELKRSGVEEDVLKEYKVNLNNELESIRIEVVKRISNLNLKRLNFFKEIGNSKRLSAELFASLKVYKQKQITPRRFYPKYFAFA